MDFNYTHGRRLLSGLIPSIDSDHYNLLELLLEGLKGSSVSSSSSISSSTVTILDTLTSKGWRVTNDTNSTIPNDTDVLLQFDTNIYSDDNIHRIDFYNSRAYIKTTGRYTIGANIEFSDSATGTRAIVIMLNSSKIIAVSEWGLALRMVVQTDYALVAGDYIEIYVKQNSGGDLDIVSNNFSPVFWGHKI